LKFELDILIILLRNKNIELRQGNITVYNDAITVTY